MALHSEHGGRQKLPIDVAAQPSFASSVVSIVLLIAALALASWIFYWRGMPTPEANNPGSSTITQRATPAERIAPRPNPMPSLAPAKQP